MAYNPYTPYPNSYQQNGYQMPNYQQMQQQLNNLQQSLYTPQQQPQQTQVQTNTYAWVNGLEGAKAYMVAPNSSILLMDNDKQSFYIKTANAQGQATMEAYEYKKASEKKAKEKELDLSGYVKQSDFDNLNKKFEELQKSLAKKEK